MSKTAIEFDPHPGEAEARRINPELSLVGQMSNNDLDHRVATSALPGELGFGRLSLTGGEDENPAESDVSSDKSENKPPFEQKTEIEAVGTGRKVEVSIKRDLDGNPVEINDQFGKWQSEDGGKTWKTGEPTFRVRRGQADIDGEGNYSFNDQDFGVRNIFSKDGTWTREMQGSNGTTYRVTKDSRGNPVSFTDQNGDWQGDGNNWRNVKTGEARIGKVTLSEYGEFKFESKDKVEVQKTEALERTEKLKESIEKEYGVTIARPGEIKKDEDGGRQLAGMPTEPELKVLQDSLAKTRHEDYRGMKIWFISPHNNKEVDTLGTYENDGDRAKKPHSCSGGCGHKPGKTPGGDLVLLPKTRQDLGGMSGLEGTILHELAHHEQGERYGHQDEWGGRKSGLASRDIADQHGWTFSKRHGEHLLKDRDGGLWRFQESREQWRWTGGKPPSDGKRRLDSEDMKDRALVPPISDYFPNPQEHQAEALSAFRFGVGEQPDDIDRKELALKSPQLYKITRDFDQNSIDLKFGRNSDGQPNYIRDLTGHLVPNTEESLSRVKRAEQSWGIK